MTSEVSLAHQQFLDQVDASFRDFAERLGMLRQRLIDAGFSEDGAESMCELIAAAWADD